MPRRDVLNMINCTGEDRLEIIYYDECVDDSIYERIVPILKEGSQLITFIMDINGEDK